MNRIAAEGLSFPFEAPAPGQAMLIAPGVLWLRVPLPLVLNHVNTYAFEDDDGWTLIDPGLHDAATCALWEELLAGPLAGRPVARVLVTHHHPDHIGMAGWFQKRGAELLITRTAWLYARMLMLDVQKFLPAETLEFLRRAGMPPPILASYAAEPPFNLSEAVAPLPPGYVRIVEGQVLRLAGRRWRVRLGDGHAPDHATLWSEEGDGLILGGDQFLPGISPNIGVYSTEPQADPLGEWLDCCRRFGAIAGDGDLVLPGHKKPFRGLPARMAALVAEHEHALARIRERLARGPATACDLFPVLYRREIRLGEYGLALIEAVAHLNRLGAAGIARAEPGPEGALHWHLA